MGPGYRLLWLKRAGRADAPRNAPRHAPGSRLPQPFPRLKPASNARRRSVICFGGEGDPAGCLPGMGWGRRSNSWLRSLDARMGGTWPQTTAICLVCQLSEPCLFVAPDAQAAGGKARLLAERGPLLFHKMPWPMNDKGVRLLLVAAPQTLIGSRRCCGVPPPCFRSWSTFDCTCAGVHMFPFVCVCVCCPCHVLQSIA